MKTIGVATTVIWLVTGVHAEELSMQRVTDNVYALNANYGFVVTADGVVLIDSGASRAGAQLLSEHAPTRH